MSLLAARRRPQAARSQPAGASQENERLWGGYGPSESQPKWTGGRSLDRPQLVEHVSRLTASVYVQRNMLERGTTIAATASTRVLGQGGMGDGVRGDPAVAQSQGRAQAARRAPERRRRASASASGARGRCRRGSSTRTSSRSTRRARRSTGCSSRCGWCAGRTLKDLITSRELDVGRTLRILTPVADALDAGARESGSSTATSSPRTSWSAAATTRSWPTSASPRRPSETER